MNQKTTLSEYAIKSANGIIDNAYYENSKIAEMEMMKNKNYELAIRKFMEKNEEIK
jgi:hypothetical protein